MIKFSQITFNNILAYNIGNFRYNLYYSKRFKWLLRKHIVEQIDVRINSMNKECYNKGECVICGCSTTALQMANKSCDKPCYPKMQPYFKWKKAKKRGWIKDKNGYWMFKNNKFELL